MGKLIVMPSTNRSTQLNRSDGGKRNHIGMTTADFRRFLSNLQDQPPSHREFLRKLLRRALAAHGPNGFPVTILAEPST